MLGISSINNTNMLKLMSVLTRDKVYTFALYDNEVTVTITKLPTIANRIKLFSSCKGNIIIFDGEYIYVVYRNNSYTIDISKLFCDKNISSIEQLGMYKNEVVILTDTGTLYSYSTKFKCWIESGVYNVLCANKKYKVFLGRDGRIFHYNALTTNNNISFDIEAANLVSGCSCCKLLGDIWNHFIVYNKQTILMCWAIPYTESVASNNKVVLAVVDNNKLVLNSQTIIKDFHGEISVVDYSCVDSNMYIFLYILTRDNCCTRLYSLKVVFTNVCSILDVNLVYTDVMNIVAIGDIHTNRYIGVVLNDDDTVKILDNDPECVSRLDEGNYPYLFKVEDKVVAVEDEPILYSPIKSDSTQ